MAFAKLSPEQVKARAALDAHVHESIRSGKVGTASELVAMAGAGAREIDASLQRLRKAGKVKHDRSAKKWVAV